MRRRLRCLRQAVWLRHRLRPPPRGHAGSASVPVSLARAGSPMSERPTPGSRHRQSGCGPVRGARERRARRVSSCIGSRAGGLVLLHTEVADGFEGHGVGGSAGRRGARRRPRARSDGNGLLPLRRCLHPEASGVRRPGCGVRDSRVRPRDDPGLRPRGLERFYDDRAGHARHRADAWPRRLHRVGGLLARPATPAR